MCVCRGQRPPLTTAKVSLLFILQLNTEVGKSRTSLLKINWSSYTHMHVHVHTHTHTLLSSVLVWTLLQNAPSASVLESQDANGNTPVDIAWKGTTVRHRNLAKKMESWVVTPSYQRMIPWLIWWQYALMPGGILCVFNLIACCYYF